MNKNFRRLLMIIASIVTITALFAACGPADFSKVSEEDIQGLKDYVISTFYMEKPAAADAPRSIDDSEALSRATVPVHTSPATFVNGVVSFDYPERGQVTRYSVANAGTNLYRITSVTTYPLNDAITDTTEAYYIKDESPIGTWDTADPVVNASGELNTLFRDTFQTTYADGTIRYYQIDATKAETDPAKKAEYKSFSLDGSMDFPAAFVLETDTAALWSSAVSYMQSFNKKFSMWNRRFVALVGTQYYTEHLDPVLLDPANPIKTFVAYERVIDTKAAVQGNSLEKLRAYIWGSAETPDLTALTLATTVIRYQIDAAGTKTLRQRTVIFNDFGDDFVFESADGSEPVLATYLAQ